MPTRKRTYSDGCAAAHALDLIGERWALLVVRELLLGPKRFTSLREGLPKASPDVLARRLRQLERAGVLRRRKLPPPAACWVYELTEWGMELEAVIIRLGRWGARSPGRPRDGALSNDSLVLSLRTMFDPGAAKGFSRASYELRLGEERFWAVVEDGRLEIARGVLPERPGAIIETDSATLAALLYEGGELSEALGSGEIKIEGDSSVVERFLRLFPLPEPAAPAVGPTPWERSVGQAISARDGGNRKATDHGGEAEGSGSVGLTGDQPGAASRPRSGSFKGSSPPAIFSSS